ncbi:MAG: N-acetylmuramoyl-L-alanine amidase, partial [Prochlorococcaceae cyanobacterium]
LRKGGPDDGGEQLRRLQIGSTEILPTVQADAVQPSIGHPLFEMAMQGDNAPVILRVILRDNRAWCRVLVFARELGITTFFEPLALRERRGS